MGGRAIQDDYPDDFAHCYGCGRLNEHGHHIRSVVEGDAVVCTFRPAPHHTALPGYVYGGLIASLVDCHSMSTAAAAWMRARGMQLGAVPTERFVTASLKIDYLAPTPIGVDLTLRARAEEVGERKVIVDCEVEAAGRVTARGRTVAVRIPERMTSECKA